MAHEIAEQRVLVARHDLLATADVDHHAGESNEPRRLARQSRCPRLLITEPRARVTRGR